LLTSDQLLGLDIFWKEKAKAKVGTPLWEETTELNPEMIS